MAIITVSRQCYSFGDEIAKKVADDLGYNFIDKQKIGNALAGLGLPANQIERFDEKKPSIWDLLAIEHEKFSCMMKAVIYGFAAADNTLILGRGAQILLQHFKGVLHLRIVAPFDIRLKRLMERDGDNEKNGEKMLRHKDRDSSGYIQSFFHADWNDPDYYDFIINTTTLSIASAAQMIMHAVAFEEFKNVPGERSGKLAALSLQYQTEAVLMELQRGSNSYIVVTHVDKGVVTLGGTCDSETLKSNCGMVISEIDGVRGVKNEIVVVKATAG
ncbi:putative transport-associated protein [Desulfosarcina variabilis str. Montpellier]|uniref:cytidylate kinase family protein n=1 Tax=Desulfosarcina variabilis TaxID=2300 RepID=UPI003AFB1A53